MPSTVAPDAADDFGDLRRAGGSLLNVSGDFLGRFRGRAVQALHFIGDDCEALARFAGVRMPAKSAGAGLTESRISAKLAGNGKKLVI